MIFQTILHNQWDLGMITKYFHSFMNSVSWIRINACEEIPLATQQVYHFLTRRKEVKKEEKCPAEPLDVV